MTDETAISTNFSPTDLIPAEDKEFAVLAAKRSFIPTFKLYSSQARAVAAGKIGIAHFGIQKSKDEIQDLGKTVDVIFYSYRYKAVEKVDSKYISYYDIKSENFIRTKKKADADKNAGHMVGIEFLCWVPALESFAIFYANNTSSLDIAKDIKAMFTKPVTMGSKFVQWKTYSWHAPTIAACSTELGLPPLEDLQAVGQAFLNPKESTTEVDTDSNSGTTDDRR